MMTSRTNLKQYFETGDSPTQSQFADLIDSLAHLDDLATRILDRANIQLNSVVAHAAGDSLTAGFGLGTPATQNWFAQACTMPQLSGATATNSAFSGWTLAQIISNYPSAGYLQRPTAGQYGIFFLWAGANDFLIPTNAGTWTTALNNFITTLNTDGWDLVVVINVMQRYNSGSTAEVARVAYNAEIDACAAQIKIDAASMFVPYSQDSPVDGTHLTAAAYKRLAIEVNNAIADYRVGRVTPKQYRQSLSNYVKSVLPINGASALTVTANSASTVTYVLQGAKMNQSAFAQGFSGSGAIFTSGLFVETAKITAADVMTVRYRNLTGSDITIGAGTAIQLIAFD